MAAAMGASAPASATDDSKATVGQFFSLHKWAAICCPWVDKDSKDDVLVTEIITGTYCSATGPPGSIHVMHDHGAKVVHVKHTDKLTDFGWALVVALTDLGCPELVFWCDKTSLVRSLTSEVRSGSHLAHQWALTMTPEKRGKDYIVTHGKILKDMMSLNPPSAPSRAATAASYADAPSDTFLAQSKDGSRLQAIGGQGPKDPSYVHHMAFMSGLGMKCPCCDVQHPVTKS